MIQLVKHFYVSFTLVIARRLQMKIKQNFLFEYKWSMIKIEEKKIFVKLKIFQVRLRITSTRNSKDSCSKKSGAHNDLQIKCASPLGTLTSHSPNAGKTKVKKIELLTLQFSLRTFH